MRAHPYLIVAFAVLALYAPYAGGAPCGTITQTGATIDSGTGTPKGTVTVDPCLEGGTPPTLPSLGTLGTLGAMPGSLPAAVGGGTGADGAYHATTATVDKTLAAGTHNFTSFEIDNGVTITCSGAVTINVQQSATIYGRLEGGATITLLIGGSLDMGGTIQTTAAIEVMNSMADIDVIANGTIRNPVGRMDIESEKGNIRLVALGTGGTGDPGFSLVNTSIRAWQGTLDILARYAIFLDDVTAYSDEAPVTVRCFDGETFITGGSSISTKADPLTIDGMSVRIDGDSLYVTTQTGTLRVAAYEGDARLEGYVSLETSGGALEVLASDGVVVFDNPYIRSNGGTATLIAYGGDVSFEAEGPGPWGSGSLGTDGGNAMLKASAGVKIGGSGRIETRTGRIDVRAFGGDLLMFEQATLGRGIFDFGPIDVRVSGGIDATIPAASSGAGHIHGSTVALSAGAGGVILDQNRVRGELGDVTILTTGPVTIDRELSAAGSIRVSTTHTTLDVTDASITTDDSTEMPTGSILLESWAGGSGVIDATDATIQSGDSTATAGTMSGAVSLLIHATGSGQEPPAVESFVLPKNVKVKLNTKNPERCRCAVAGFFDTGPDDVDLSKAASIEIGGLKVDVDGMDLNATGRKYQYKGKGLVFIVRPSKFGSSRTKFKLKFKGNLIGLVDPDAKLTLRFVSEDYDGTGTVTLTKGKYALRRVGGALVEPNLHLYKSKVKLNGGGKDKCLFMIGLATDGNTPLTGSAVRIRFGTSLDVTIPADRFERIRDSWVMKGSVGGITYVKVDYRKEFLKIKGKNVDMGAIPGGENGVFIGISVGDEERGVRVRMLRDGKKLRY